jgi:hypothetical protein
VSGFERVEIAADVLLAIYHSVEPGGTITAPVIALSFDIVQAVAPRNPAMLRRAIGRKCSSHLERRACWRVSPASIFE